MKPDPEQDEPYRPLGLRPGDLLIELQRVGDDTQPRVHLDIDTDDVDAEVLPLEQLGARRLQTVDDGRSWQMVDPGGLVFCVIPPHTPDFEDHAKVWP